MIIISILAIALEILRRIPHFVTNDLKNLGIIQNQYLIVILLAKLTELSEISNEWKMMMQLLIIALIIFRFFLIIFLFGKVIAFKYMHSNNTIAKRILKIFRKSINDLN